MNKPRFPIPLLFLTLILVQVSGCRPYAGLKPVEAGSNPEIATEPLLSENLSAEESEQNEPLSFWMPPGIPEKLKNKINLPQGIRPAENEKVSNIRLSARTGDISTAGSEITWIYALAAPFMTVMDGVSGSELTNAWSGKATGNLKGKTLLLTESTLEVFSKVWGTPVKGAVKITAPGELLVEAEKNNGLAILTFDELEPRWKVLTVDGISPLDKKMKPGDYPLAMNFVLQGNEDILERARKAGLDLPEGNWNPEYMTTLVMTGTTALVRTTALRMEEQGVNYPARDIVEWLRSADLTHISNEVPFYSECPPAKPLREEARFCSDPGYIELFKWIGVDLIELTGNHVLDWGPDAFLETLALYKEDGYPIFGGGENIGEAQKPLVVEDHGNRLAFIGCNAVGPEKALAAENTPGAAPCDFEKMTRWIQEFKSEGIIPIVTFQHFELDDFKPQSSHRIDSRNVSNAGAVIVSGSQAHHAQCMFFNGSNYIHYGLGNLFFDQMMKENRPAFIDRHVFYEGRYISTELLTTILEDGARPRPMTHKERARFLGEIFEACQQDVAYNP